MTKGDQYSFWAANNCSDQIFQQLPLLPNPESFQSGIMQMNLHCVASAPSLAALSRTKAKEFALVVRRPTRTVGGRLVPVDAWEKVIWASLAVSAIWALCLV